MANLTAITPTTAGAVVTGATAVPVTTAAGGGDSFDNDGRTVFIVKNASGGSITVTFNSLVQSNYGTDVDPVLTVAAGATLIAGPFDPVRYNDANGRVGVTYSGVTSLTVQAVRF